MKKYDITLTGHYERTISIYADSPQDAKRKTEIVLFDTDLFNFTDEDFVRGEAAITDGDREELKEEETEKGCMEYEECSDCPYFCPVCQECMYEGEE